MFGNKKRIKELEKNMNRFSADMIDRFRCFERDIERIKDTQKKQFYKSSTPAYKIGSKAWAYVYEYRQYNYKEVIVLKPYADFLCNKEIALFYKTIDVNGKEYNVVEHNLHKNKPQDKCKC